MGLLLHIAALACILITKLVSRPAAVQVALRKGREEGGGGGGGKGKGGDREETGRRWGGLLGWKEAGGCGGHRERSQRKVTEKLAEFLTPDRFTIAASEESTKILCMYD